MTGDSVNHYIRDRFGELFTADRHRIKNYALLIRRWLFGDDFYVIAPSVASYILFSIHRIMDLAITRETG